MSRRRPRRDPPTLFLDECLGTTDVPARLRATGASVRLLCDEFPPDAADVDWLATVGARGWVLLTKDKAIRRKRLEREAILSAKVAAFFLQAGDMRGPEIAEALATALPSIESLWERHEPPFIALVSPTGNVTLKFGGARRGGVKRDPTAE